MPANRILIVDDQQPIAELISNIAVGCGYQAAIARDFSSFVRLIDEWQPSHVVLDLQMPKVDGIQLLRHLAERTSRAKVLIISGMDGKLIQSAKRLGQERGLDLVATIQKPFRAAELRVILEQVKGESEWCTEAALTSAIAEGELVLFYQPKVALASRRIAGWEALVRWRHPTRGLVPPDRFLPLAEASSLIDQLNEWVFTRALRQLRDWGKAVAGRVAINLSGRCLHDIGFPDRLFGWCEVAGVAPDRLQIELTETTTMADPVLAADIMSRLRLKGIRLALDDFGTGYSSLAQLVRLPFSEIKIDKSFVLDCVTSREAQIVVRSTIDLGRNLNLRVVAEGVESEAIQRIMGTLGCEELQGYHIARPMPAEAVPAWIVQWDARQPESAPAAAETVAMPPFTIEEPLWNRSFDGSEEMKAALAAILSERLNPLWDLGRNSLLGWKVIDGGIEVLMVPYRRIVDQVGQSRRLLQGQRLMGDATFEMARALADAEPTEIELPFRVSDSEPTAVPTQVIEHVLRRYGITETLYRGVALFDIVGFSRFEPSRQIAQLNSLECSINAAQQLMEEIDRRVDLARTTTGDGFYMWNREKGPASDVDTYLLTLLALADNAIARQDGGGEFVPELRTCFAIGPHYSYFQTEGLDPRGHDYIVGDVTISLARMVSKCLPGQILIRDFLRPTDETGEPTNPIEFMIRADGAFARFNGVSLQGRSIGEMRCYLTGLESAPGAFDIARYTIRDKHGFEHAVFNQKFNVYLADPKHEQQPSNVVYLGKRQADLVGFDAELASVSLRPKGLKR